MRIIKGLNKLRKGKKYVSHEEIIERKYQTSVDAEEIKDPVGATADYVTEMIKDPSTNTEQILAATIDSNTPNKVFMEVVNRIAEDPSIPNSTIARAIDNSSSDVPDDKIIHILEGIPFKSAQDRRTLINNINDQGIREEQILYALNQFYESDFSKRNDLEMIRRLEEVYLYLDFDNGEIDKLTQKIVAKQMAIMYHNFNGAVMPQRYKVIPATTMEKMMEVNMPELVRDEYRRLYPSEPEKYNPAVVRKAILRELAIEIANVYENTNMFVIPESEAMTKLTDEESNQFINEIFSKLKIPEKEKTGARIDINQQIKAEYDVDQHAQKELDSKLSMLSKHERLQLLLIFNAIVDSKRLEDTNRILSQDTTNAIDVIGKLGSTGALESLMKIPASERRNVINAIGETVEKRFAPKKEDPSPESKTEPESLERT